MACKDHCCKTGNCGKVIVEGKSHCKYCLSLGEGRDDAVDLAAAAATAAAVAVGVEPIPMSKRYKASLAATTKVTPSTEELARIALVQNWLTKTLPQLYADDAAIYARSFVKEGFDSVQMLEGELLGDDLAFMKKAHRRALIRAKSLKESKARGGRGKGRISRR